ncbi:glycoside hydrolase family 3 protein [Lophiostoma macrostomum CBS 122681]|uniref:Probable beta-glucosidase H n=1 Tax=Lophiostoma macrostomum CBS 122681 TaxID=1314788 RepID=A0A6A6SQ00_9PLEO|nr:glycoside hydrolase family 3 protein [Lophiostoma macrostomum CBS 122681]
MSFTATDMLARLNNDQKIALLTGRDWWHTLPIEENGVPAIRMSDDPAGIRGTRFFESVPAAAIPCGSALGATWDKALVKEAGELLGKECIAKGTHCWLGPTVNIQRSPLGGRNNESFGEDSHLVGTLGSSIIDGCQSTGVAATIKHFVCNDQEDEKSSLNAIVTQRALRELYLRPFQIAARDVNPEALMTAYNKLNGFHCSEHPLLDLVVRGEWEWNPLIMSDWFGTFVGHSTVNAGVDLEMPGPTLFRGEALKTAVTTRDVRQSVLDQRAERVLKFVEKGSQLSVSSTEGGRDLPEDRALNRKLCASSIVMLQNKEGLLPISKTTKRIALIGSHMKDLSVLGLGSTALEPYYTINPFDAIKEKLDSHVELLYEVGAHAYKTLPLLHERFLQNTTMSFFNEPETSTGRRLVLENPLKRTRFHLIDFEHPGLHFDLFYVTVQADFTPDSSQLWDFSVACHGTANLYIDDELLIDNSTKQTAGGSSFSLGTVDEYGYDCIALTGRTYKLRLEFGSASTSKLDIVGGLSLGGGGASIGACRRIDIEDDIRRAERVASEADVTILCTGLSGEWEGEGNDRHTMSLPPHVDTLICRVASSCPKTVVVNLSGTPVAMPWAADVPAILQAWYGGNEAGNGIADVLFGDINPNIYVGYRYFDRIGRAPQWVFGHGLSYSSFELGEHGPRTFSQTSVSVKVRNTSKIRGAEVLQLYIKPPANSTIARPVKELQGFEKVLLEPGQETDVKIDIDPYAMSYWDEPEEKWCIERGTYRVIVATSSSDDTGNGLLRIEENLQVEKTRYWLGL